MKFLLITVLVYFSVNCEDVGNNNYVIEMPEDVSNKKPSSKFQVYWNVPTMQCKSKKIPFNNLYEKFGVIQNNGDKFHGEEITILYEPGLFPAIFKNETSGKYRFRNGGVPQEGNLEEHIDAFKKEMQEIVPDPDFSGVGVIDFESWRPIFRQNFGTLVPYKDVSIEIEKKLHWWWPKIWINSEAQRRFEEAARIFMQTTLSIAKQMRPKAKWGYYGFPHCFNTGNGQNTKAACPSNVIAENDATHWLWLETTALYPSVYSSSNLSSSQLGMLVRGRVEETRRVRRYNSPIFPYFWFRYRDGGFMKQEDLTVVLQSLYKSSASGFIIWGSSNDVNTVAKCQKLHDYVETILGPTIAKFIQKIDRLDDAIIEPAIENNLNEFNVTLPIVIDVTITTEATMNDTINLNPPENNNAQLDPDFIWVPSENYTQDISYNVEEELKKKRYNKTDAKRNEMNNLSESFNAVMFIKALSKSEYSKQTNKQVNNDTQSELFVTSATDIISEEQAYHNVNSNTSTPVGADLTESSVSNIESNESLDLNKETLLTTDKPIKETTAIIREHDVKEKTESAEVLKNIYSDTTNTNYYVTEVYDASVETSTDNLFPNIGFIPIDDDLIVLTNDNESVIELTAKNNIAIITQDDNDNNNLIISISNNQTYQLNTNEIINNNDISNEENTEISSNLDEYVNTGIFTTESLETTSEASSLYSTTENSGLNEEVDDYSFVLTKQLKSTTLRSIENGMDYLIILSVNTSVSDPINDGTNETEEELNIRNVHISDMSVSDDDLIVANYFNDKQTDTSTDIINSDSIEYSRSTNSEVRDTTESTDKVVTYVYNS